jgi:hypothetical protein
MLNIGGIFPNLRPGYTRLDCLLRFVKETNHSFHHPQSLPNGAELIMLGVAVLLEEVLLD